MITTGRKEEVQSDSDLSAGSLTTTQKADVDNQREDAKQRRLHRKLLVIASLIFVAVLSICFLKYTHFVMCMYELNSGLIDWHILLLGSTLIIPPTLVLFALTRAAFTEPKRETDEDVDLVRMSPLIDTITKLMELAKRPGP